MTVFKHKGIRHTLFEHASMRADVKMRESEKVHLDRTTLRWNNIKIYGWCCYYWFYEGYNL